MLINAFNYCGEFSFCDFSFHSCNSHFFFCFILADDEEDADDHTHTEHGKNHNLKSEQKREMFGDDAMTDTETNYDDGKIEGKELMMMTMIGTDFHFWPNLDGHFMPLRTVENFRCSYGEENFLAIDKCACCRCCLLVHACPSSMSFGTVETAPHNFISTV